MFFSISWGEGGGRFTRGDEVSSEVYNYEVKVVQYGRLYKAMEKNRLLLPLENFSVEPGG